MGAEMGRRLLRRFPLMAAGWRADIEAQPVVIDHLHELDEAFEGYRLDQIGICPDVVGQRPIAFLARGRQDDHGNAFEAICP